MIIKKIDLYNFRQFYKNQSIEFSQDENQNITLILGDNTSGKTTLLQSFLWCFYGEANFKSKEAIINATASQEMLLNYKNDEEVKVSIELEHQNVNYYITRTLNHYIKNNEVKSDSISKIVMTYKEKDGQQETIPTYQIASKIGEILPENLSTYFLYDTERFGNITSKSDVTSSVKGILGLTVLENMIKHLGKETKSRTVLYQFNSNLNLAGNQIAKEAFDKVKQCEDEKEKNEERLMHQKSELEKYYSLKAKKEEILRSLASSSKLQEDKDRKTKDLVLELSLLKEAQSDYYKNFKNNSFMYLGQSMLNKVKVELEGAELDKKSIRDMNANAIKDIIARGKCVCGTVILEGNDAHTHLLDEIRYLPPESIGTLVKYFKDKADTYLQAGEGYFTSLNSSYKNTFQRKLKIGELEDEIQYLNEELKKKDSVTAHQEQLMEYEKKVRNIESMIEQLNRNIGVLANKVNENKEIYEKHISVSDKNNEILTYMAYTNKILEWVTKRYQTREKEIKDQLEEKVNEYFKKMYHGNRKVSIDDKFKVNLITTNLNEDIYTDESQGLETVKNFAFIAGLVDLAKQKLKDSYEKDSEAYPLILDAPFSNADEKHVLNISEVLPKVANQLILIVMAKDWNYAKDSMSSKVGREYYLDKQSEVYTKIVEVK